MIMTAIFLEFLRIVPIISILLIVVKEKERKKERK